MASQPLSDDVLNDTSGFDDPTPTPAPAPAAKPEAADADEPLELTNDQALDDSLADAGDDGDKPDEKQENPVEKRIKGALKARDDARNQLENERAEKADLARRLAAIEAKMSPEKSEEAPAEVAPNPEDYEFGALDQNYLDAAMEYKVNLRLREALGGLETQYQEQQARAAQAAEHQKTVETAKDIVAKGAALYDDFEEVVWERGLREEYRLDKPTFDALTEADHPAEIAYALASDPVEAERVASLSPIQQIKYVMAKDAELGGKPARVTKAPAPPGQPVRGSSGKYTVAADTEDLEAFEKEFYKKKS